MKLTEISIGQKVWINSDNYEGFKVCEVLLKKSSAIIVDKNDCKYCYPISDLYCDYAKMAKDRKYFLNHKIADTKTVIEDCKDRIKSYKAQLKMLEGFHVNRD